MRYYLFVLLLAFAPSQNEAASKKVVSSGQGTNLAPSEKVQYDGNAYSQLVRYTRFNEGNKRSHYLDRHWMHCPYGKAIRGFRLQRDRAHRNYRYFYICGSIQSSCHQRLKVNRRTYNGKGNMVYLDRQTVNCGYNSVITQVGLKRRGNRSWYRYHCCRLRHRRQQCHFRYTRFNSDGRGNTVYLDRHYVMCPYGTTMSYFKLQRNWAHNKVRYVYKCCKTLR